MNGAKQRQLNVVVVDDEIMYVFIYQNTHLHIYTCVYGDLKEREREREKQNGLT